MEAKWDTVLQKRCLSGCQTTFEALSMRQPVWSCENVRENTKRLNVSPGLLLILSAVTFIFFGTNIYTANPAEGKKVPCCYPTRHIHHSTRHDYVLKDKQTITSLLHVWGFEEPVRWFSRIPVCESDCVSFLLCFDSALCNRSTVHCRCMWHSGLFANPWWKTLKVVRHFDGLQFTRLSTWWQVWQMN